MLKAAIAVTVLSLTMVSSAVQAQADPTPPAGAGCTTVFCDGFTQRNTHNDDDPGDPADGSGGRSVGEVTKPEICPGHQIVNGKHKCDLVKHHPADDTPSDTQLRQVIAKLRLPDPTPRLGPDPSVNEWKMLAVGYPIWLWTDQPTHLTTTAHHDGLTFTLDAQLTSTSFDMGEKRAKTCATTTPYPGYTGYPSPTCSYTYETPNPIGHPYTITATTNWTITWTTNGHHGTLTHTTTGTRTLEVGELQSLLVSER